MCVFSHRYFIFKFFVKLQKLPKNTQKPKSQIFNNTCKEASNKKDQKTNYSQNGKISRITFLKISKPKKLPQKSTKNKKNLKFKKSCKEASYDKSLENNLLLKLKNIKNDIYENFKLSKLTPKRLKKQKLKIPIVM